MGGEPPPRAGPSGRQPPRPEHDGIQFVPYKAVSQSAPESSPLYGTPNILSTDPCPLLLHNQWARPTFP